MSWKRFQDLILLMSVGYFLIQSRQLLISCCPICVSLVFLNGNWPRTLQCFHKRCSASVGVAVQVPTQDFWMRHLVQWESKQPKWLLSSVLLFTSATQHSPAWYGAWMLCVVQNGAWVFIGICRYLYSQNACYHRCCMIDVYTICTVLIDWSQLNTGFHRLLPQVSPSLEDVYRCL